MNVILNCFAPCEPFGLLTDGIPVAMLPVLNKPIIEHLLEQCSEADLARIHVAVVEQPRAVRRFLGGGERWGLEIEISSMKDPYSNQQLLKRISHDREEPCLLIPAETIIDLEFRTLLEFHERSGNQVTRVMARITTPHPGEEFSDSIVSQTDPPEEFLDTGIMVVNAPFDVPDSGGEYLFHGDWVRVQNPAHLWEANTKGVYGRFPGLRRPAVQNKDGNWFGHHCAVHPHASIASPVFVGNHARIGHGAEILEGSVLGNGVIVDADATVRSSVVMDSTYVGAQTNIEERIVRGRFVLNVRTGSAIEVSDPIIVSGAREKTFGPSVTRLIGRVIAALLLLVTSPVWVMKGLIRAASGQPFFHRKSFLLGHTREPVSMHQGPTPVTLRTFEGAGPFISRLPGLLDVLTGSLALVGTRPLTEHERTLLSEDWTDLRDTAPEGLFTPVDAEGLVDPTEDEKVVIENYYAATRSTMGDFRILTKSFFNLVFPSRPVDGAQ